MYFKNIRNLREDNDLTLQFVSDFLHCSKRNYQRYEKGELEITATKALLLSGLYNVSLDYLLGLTNEFGNATRQTCLPHRRLKLLRRKNHLTQEEVSTTLFCRSDVYSRYELGLQEVPIQMVIMLSKLYNVSTDYILGCSNRRSR